MEMLHVESLEPRAGCSATEVGKAYSLQERIAIE